MNALIVES